MNKHSNDLICFSHLRWAFVFQRPQHLMSRFAKTRRVFFVEEPIFEECEPQIRSTICPHTGVDVMTPVLPHGLSQESMRTMQRELLEAAFANRSVQNHIAWYYTPMAIEFAPSLASALVVYDCMDELTQFAGAPPAMARNERALFAIADLVFTGGASLFTAKRRQHSAVYLFPSSVDTEHFRRARTIAQEAPDQAPMARPRIGYAGVIDERMDLDLLRAAAEQRPDWQFVLLGPVVKIDPASLPRRENIHFLGMKRYAELPAYFSGWKIGMLPFALNDATRFVSPTKTPEYLAAGLRVISTPIYDVVTQFGELGLVEIAHNVDEFVAAADKLLTERNTDEFQIRAERFLSSSSWDKTWDEMTTLLEASLDRKQRVAIPRTAGLQKDAVHV